MGGGRRTAQARERQGEAQGRAVERGGDSSGGATLSRLDHSALLTDIQRRFFRAILRGLLLRKRR
jgi:hypothetical protein